jgi:phthiocerol/phenolphthiocerol synthesis type-I polyketide synthase C
MTKSMQAFPSSPYRKMPIAVVGAAARLPGAPTIEEFWKLLAESRDAVTEIPDERWNRQRFFHPRVSEPGKSYSWKAGVIDSIDMFDAAAFGISAREARQMDPQQRLLLELAVEAVEDGGLRTAGLRNACVYVGASSTEYANRRLSDPASGDAYFMTGNTLSIFANRLSYALDLHGPSVTVDTACSSSLVALHLACEELRAGRSHAAIVGGVNLLLSPYPFIGFSRAGMLSLKGRCAAFDAAADGYVRAEGGVVLVLKPLPAALAEGDDIRGLILATGTNSDGRTAGLSYPGQASQEALLDTLYRESGILPEWLDFIEAHGTGTVAGDRVETAALGSVLGRRRTLPLPIGSVKTNIGHLEAASGLAGVLKVLLSLEKGCVPRSLHYTTPCPAIDFDALNLRVVEALTPLPPGARRIAGVNNFGFGGTNAHVVLAASPDVAVRSVADADADAALPPLLLSARSETSLRRLAAFWSERLRDPDAEVLPLLRGAARKRDHHLHRLAVVAAQPEELAERLADFATDGTARDSIAGTALQDGRIGFVFSGNGAQFAGMARTALATNASFSQAVAELDAALRPELGWSVRDRLAMGTAAKGTDMAQPMLLAVQMGIVAALRPLGIVPAATIGHSLGEVAAAWAAGALTTRDAAQVVLERSRRQHSLKGDWAMAVLGITPSNAAELIACNAAAGDGGAVEIAAVNAPRSVTLVGPAPALARLRIKARASRLAFAPIDASYPFHSAGMNSIADGLQDALRDLSPGPSNIPFFSTVTGAKCAGTVLDAGYWWRNVREPVLFADALRRAAADDISLILEIGPQPVLQSYIRDTMIAAAAEGSSNDSGGPFRVLTSLHKREPETDPFPAIAMACHVAGADISESRIYDGTAAARALPRSGWDRERHWYTTTQEAYGTLEQGNDHPLLGSRVHPEIPIWSNQIDTVLHPDLADHRLGVQPTLSAAAMLDMALSAGCLAFSTSGIELLDFEIHWPLSVESERLRELRSEIDPVSGRFELSSRPRFANQTWTAHAVGQLLRQSAAPLVPDWVTPKMGTKSKIVEAATLYAAAAEIGFGYGPAYQGVEHIEIDTSDTATVVLRPTGLVGPGRRIDPTQLDAALQGLLVLATHDRAGHIDTKTMLLPWRFGRVRLPAQPSSMAPATARLRLRHRLTRAICADIGLYDGNGRLLLLLEDCWFRARPVEEAPPIADRTAHVALIPAPFSLSIATGPESQAGAGTVVIAGTHEVLDTAFVRAALLETLWDLAPASGEIIPEQLAPTLIASESVATLVNFLHLLAATGDAWRDGAAWRLAPRNTLPPAREIWQSLFFEAPERVTLNAALIQSLETMSDRLRQGPDAILPPCPLSGAAAAACLDAHAAALFAHWSINRTLRISEWVGPLGSVARPLLERLDAAGLPYLFTAVVPEGDDPVPVLFDLAGFGRARGIGAGRDGATEKADLIIAAGLPNDPLQLEQMHAQLATGGRLLLAVPAPGPALDFLQLAATANPAPGAEAWCGAVTAIGFSAATAIPQSASPWPILCIAATCSKDLATLEPPRPPALVIAEPGSGGALAAALRACIRDPECAHACAPLIVLLPREDREADPVTAAATALDDAARVARIAVLQGAKLMIVTRNATDAAGAPDPVEAARLGFARVLANEYPAIACRRVDLCGTLDLAVAAENLLAEAMATDNECETVHMPQGRFAARVLAGLPPTALAPVPVAVRLAQPSPGRLRSLRWESMEKRAPATDEVSISVRAVGLNFRDVLWAMNLLPDEAMLGGFAGATLGMECAGIVEAVGAEVPDFALGDRVMAFAPAAFASHVITNYRAVMALPPEIDFAAAATLPVASLTAIHALSVLADLKEGETVLIHGGAGGVGIAAIQVAHHLGARIFATAGTEAKRAVLRGLGVELVLDSRTLRFADDIRAHTGGKGVDVVLNSLAGEAMERSLSLLRPFGRFIELGKRDFYANSRIGLRNMRSNISYFALDADALLSQREDRSGPTMQRLTLLLAKGILRPLPYERFPFAAAAKAFQLMRRSGHIGKIVVEPGPVATEAPTDILRSDRSFIIVGGVGGFGLATARYFVRAGVRHIALLSRRGPADPEAEAARAVLHADGAEKVMILACDAADREALREGLATVRATLPPIGGIVHAAMVLEDALAEKLDHAAATRVLRAKLGVALALDAETRADPVETFLLFSSATTLFGSPGQGSYVAANRALEAVAACRRAEGLPALAIAWGAIANTGVLAGQGSAMAALQRRTGVRGMQAQRALATLPALVRNGAVCAAVAEVDWAVGKGTLPILAEQMFSWVGAGLTAETETVPADFRTRLTGLPPETAAALVLEMLRAELAQILQVDAERLDTERSFADLGMDSLMAVELTLALERRIGAPLPNFAWQDLTPNRIAASIARQLVSADSAEETIEVVSSRHLTAAERASLVVPTTIPSGTVPYVTELS